MRKDFYIYEWYNTDTNEVFYVGKGTKNRYKDTYNRNKYFKNYYNKYNCSVRKVKIDLDENEAFKLEMELIKQYWELEQCKCNLTEGGEGCTLKEGTWSYYFRKLQYLHDIKGSMDEMINEEDYRPENLKTKTLDQLKGMYVQYSEYIEGVTTARHLGLYKKIDGYELMMQNKEIIWLTELFAKDIANINKQFKEFLNYKTEMDFICNSIDTDKFLSLIYNKEDYCIEFLTIIFNNLEFLKLIYDNPNIKIKSHKVDGNYLYIRFHTRDDWSTKNVKINLYDIIWGILMYKSKPLYEIILEEIFVAPIL